MVELFQSLGYTVGNLKGKNHVTINIISLILAVAYLFFSHLNLRQASPSFLMLLINITNLLALILNNVIELLKLSNSSKFTEVLGMAFSKSPIIAIKTCLELGIVLTITFFLVYNLKEVVVVNRLIKGVAYMVLLCTFIENLISVFGRLYDVHLNLEGDSQNNAETK